MNYNYDNVYKEYIDYSYGRESKSENKNNALEQYLQKKRQERNQISDTQESLSENNKIKKTKNRFDTSNNHTIESRGIHQDIKFSYLILPFLIIVLFFIALITNISESVYREDVSNKISSIIKEEIDIQDDWMFLENPSTENFVPVHIDNYYLFSTAKVYVNGTQDLNEYPIISYSIFGKTFYFDKALKYGIQNFKEWED